MKKILISILSLGVAFVLTGPSTIAVSDADFQNAFNQIKESRQTFKEAKAQEANEAGQVGKAKNQAQREAAQQRREAARQKIEEKRKEVLLRLVDIQIKHLNQTKERVQKMPNITEELKTQLNTEVEAAIQKLNEQKVKVESATGEEAIKAVAKEIRDFFRTYQEIAKKIVEAILASRANNAAAKAEERLATVKAKVQELKNQEKDTTELETEIEKAEKDIDEARGAIGRKAFREANEDLKGAYQKFRNIAQKAKGL